MKDVSNVLYSALFSSLNGNITYQGQTIPVFELVPQSAQNDYIYLADLNLSESSAKDRFMQNGYINIQIITRLQHDGSSNVKLDNICNQVKQALKPTITAVPSLSPNFNCTFFYLENDIKDYSLEDVEQVTRRILRFRIEVEEL